MKKLIILLSLASLSLHACNKGTATENEGGLSGEPTKAEASKEAIAGTIKLTRAEFLSRVVDFTKNTTEIEYLGDKPCIIDFYADWCGPCRIAAPIMEELAREYAGKIYIYKVDTQKEQQLATELGIQGIPAFLFFPTEGKPFGTSGIAQTPAETKKKFKEIIDRELLKITP